MKKYIHVICSLLVIVAAGCSNKKTASEVSLRLDPQKAEWFKDAKFGMFIHWGLYSILEGSYNGHTMPDTTFQQGNSWYAEWIKPRLEVPDDYYNGLTMSSILLGMILRAGSERLATRE